MRHYTFYMVKYRHNILFYSFSHYPTKRAYRINYAQWKCNHIWGFLSPLGPSKQQSLNLYGLLVHGSLWSSLRSFSLMPSHGFTQKICQMYLFGWSSLLSCYSLSFLIPSHKGRVSATFLTVNSKYDLASFHSQLQLDVTLLFGTHVTEQEENNAPKQAGWASFGQALVQP